MSLRPLLVLAAVFCGACNQAPATIEFTEQVPMRPRVNEITTVKFVLKDYRGVPQAGTMVTFSIEGSADGIVLSPVTAMSIRGSGEASTQIIAGSPGQSIVVVANAGGGRIAKTPQITFAGTVPSANQMTFQCGPIAGGASGGIHAIGAYDRSRHLVAGVKLNCTAHVGDRNGDGVPGASVSFYTEAGTINPTESSMTDFVGNATVLYKTSLPLPVSTDPLVFQWNPDTSCAATDKTRCNGEYLVPLWMEPQSWTQNPLGTLLMNNPPHDRNNLREPRRFDPVRRLATNPTQMPQNNPRDNLVTMIAWTNGEEGFIDKNANGTFDADEQPEDITEPFVDANDTGTYEIEEKYVDSNNNGVWDGKNANWDANTVIWREERIIWTGVPFRAQLTGQLDDTTAPEPSMRGGQPLMGIPTVRCFGSIPFVLNVSDPWFNSMARNGGGDGCKKQAASKNVDTTDNGITGIAFTYPAVRGYFYGVIDNLERTPMPMTTPPQPGCFPPPFGVGTGSTPQEWSAVIACQFTASPENGHIVIMNDEVSGQIFNNLPSVPP